MRVANAYPHENSPVAKLALCTMLIAIIGMLYTAYLVLEPQDLQKLISQQAYVTLMTDDQQLPGVQVVLKSLQNTKTQRNIVLMVSENVTKQALETIQGNFKERVTVKKVKRVPFRDPKSAKSVIEEKSDEYTKLRAWELPYARIVFVEYDCVVLKNLDSLFDTSSATTFAAAPDCCGKFNSGVFVASPLQETFIHFAKELKKATQHQGEQDFLNGFFGDQWVSLSFHYNSQQHHILDNPTQFRFEDMKVLRYNKYRPWLQTDYSKSPHQQVLQELSEKWWKVAKTIPTTATTATPTTTTTPTVPPNKDNDNYRKEKEHVDKDEN